jgi:hypothetical protein
MDVGDEEGGASEGGEGEAAAAAECGESPAEKRPSNFRGE